MALTIVNLVLLAIVIAGIIGVLLVVARQSGISIPPFVIQILWIIIVVVIGVVAVKFLASLL